MPDSRTFSAMLLKDDRMADRNDAPSLMLREAREGPAVAARLLAANRPICRALAERLTAKPPRFIVTAARGSSDSAASFVKYLAEIRLGLVTASLGPSVRSIYGIMPAVEGALFLAISQSGRSPDLLMLAEAAKTQGAVTLAVVNDESSPLAKLCEFQLPLHAGPEASVAATKSYIAALAALLQLVAIWSGDRALNVAADRLPDDLEMALAQDWSAARPLLAPLAHLFVAGRGVGFAVAQEAALKLKEIAGIHAEAVSAAELQHGPMALAGAQFPLLLFAQDDAARESLSDLATGFRARDIPVMAAGPIEAQGILRLPVVKGLAPFTAPIAAIQSFYPLAEAVARDRGRDPDRPPFLSKVTRTL
jgi:glucosamine--fructose-6-phosphate aminotransferase (isomerizing)